MLWVALLPEGVIFSAIVYHWLGLILYLCMNVGLAVFLNKARKTVQNRSLPRIEDRRWEVN